MVPQKLGVLFLGGPYKKDYGIWESFTLALDIYKYTGYGNVRLVALHVYKYTGYGNVRLS